jgi:hypothetical protein
MLLDFDFDILPTFVNYIMINPKWSLQATRTHVECCNDPYNDNYCNRWLSVK